MPRKPIEEVYRDSSIPDDRTLRDLMGDLGEDMTIGELRRAYRGFEQKIQQETETRRKEAEAWQKQQKEYEDIFRNASARIAELETGYADAVAKIGNPTVPQQDPWADLQNDPLAAPVLKALEAKIGPALKKLADIESSIQQRDNQFSGLTNFVSRYGDVLLTETNRQAFNDIADREPDITFEDAYQTAVKEELWNDGYRAKDPNLKVPDVRKGYEKLAGPKKMEKMIQEAERRGREAALREARSQTFFPPRPSSSSLGNNPSSGPKNMEEAFRELSNDPTLQGFPFN